MKILKKLSALIAVVAMFGTTALAADYNLKADDYVAGATTVSVSMYAADGINYLGGGSSIGITYDNTVFEYVDYTANFGNEVTDQGTYVSWADITYSNYTVPSDNKLIFTLNFKVKEGQNPVGKTFSTTNDALLNESWGVYDSTSSVTIVAAAGEEKTEATIGATGDVTFDYAEGDSASSALAGKRVVLDTANEITGNVKDKKVAVTYTEAGSDPIVKTFGETLNELLGLDGDGSVTATVRFGIVCDSSLTGTFTFAIVD